MLTLLAVFIASPATLIAGRWIAAQTETPALTCGAIMVAAIAVGCGGVVYLDRGQSVSSARALIGAVIAAVFLGTLPPALFLRWGFRMESRRALAVFWLVAVVPLAIYVLAVTVEVEKLSMCLPHAYECPI